MNEKICYTCNSVLPNDYTYCPYDGELLHEDPQLKACPVCGKQPTVHVDDNGWCAMGCWTAGVLKSVSHKKVTAESYEQAAAWWNAESEPDTELNGFTDSAVQSIRTGLQQKATIDKGSFAQYAEDDIPEEMPGEIMAWTENGMGGDDARRNCWEAMGVGSIGTRYRRADKERE